MFSTLRNRFGIPGVISVIALVFAMFGGAYAASNSSGGDKATASAKGKKGPRGPKGATGPAGPAGAQGPAGPAGAKGDAGANGAVGGVGPAGPTGPTGAKGATGLAGAAGATGPEGSPWTAGGTLPPGRTETGTWVAEAFNFPAAFSVLSQISFPIPLAAASEEGKAHVLNQKETEENEEEEGTDECTGSAENPTAPAGLLCIYTKFESGFENFGFTTLLDDRENVYGPSGTVLRHIFKNGSERSEAAGTWAVTAPTP